MTGYDSTTTVEEPTTGSSFDTETAETHPLVDAGQQATASAGHLAERAADVGIQQADHGRELAAEGIDKVARAVRRLSTDMEADQPQIAGVALTAADQADKVAQYLRETDARQMIGNVEDAARKTPLLFLGGAFLLGMAASRFIKAAGGDRSRRPASDPSPATDGLPQLEGLRGHWPGRHGQREREVLTWTTVRTAAGSAISSAISASR